ncbi:MAG TPA: hypothetical protein DGN60_02030 [Chloroflexi bacterium]|nr:hypothetical protein [Chloroflexota bacterium]|tara:strand:+ start:1716 stop:2540 length:825 start_codon:yes stop_codon:yes gene_type:complete
MYPEDDIFSKQLREIPAFRALLRSIEARMIMELEFPAPVLDFGCGDGHFGHISLRCFDSIGIDPSKSSLDEADVRKCYRALVQADNQGLPFESGSFNSALCNSVLEHISNVESALSEIRRVLNPGCKLVFTVPSELFRDFLAVKSILQKWRLYRLAEYYEIFFDKISRHTHYHTPAEWKVLLNNTGFSMESCTYYCSKTALQAIELGHYFGLPSLLLRKLTGNWILSKRKKNLRLTDKIFRPHYEEKLPAHGAYMIIVAKHTGNKSNSVFNDPS